MAYSIILARLRKAIVDVYLTPGAGKSVCTVAFEPVDMVHAETAIKTGRIGAFVYVYLALGASETRHTDASESAGIV